MAADATAADVDQRVAEILKKAHQTALTILKENDSEMHAIAAFLLERETITGEEFMELLNRTLVENGKPALHEEETTGVDVPQKAEKGDGDPVPQQEEEE